MSEVIGARQDERVVLLAPTAKDAAMTERVFAGIGAACTACLTVEGLCNALEAGVGAVVLTEHACALNDIGCFISLLREQQPWSDLPVVVLVDGGASSVPGRRAIAMFGNVTILERPVQMASLASVVSTLIRSRRRQYQLREYLRERETLLSNERAARGEAERVSRVKDEFLATLSHELRTPLNAILGWSQILGSTARPDDEELVEGLQTIERNARAQTQIIEDLLDMSRIINGKLRLDTRRIELIPVIEAALNTVRPAADAKEIRIRTVLDPSAGSILGDYNRLQQVFWNLLANAVKFTPRGGELTVLLERADAQLRVRVIDSGEGIDPAFLPHIFDRFRQADPSTTRRHGGLGLGLAIVRQLVEVHGGTICAQSPGTGQGSTFVVTFPLGALHTDHPTEPEHRDPTPSIQRHLHAEARALGGVKVLVVDDEPDALALVKRLLEDCQVTVFTAASAFEAFQKLQQELPDVLVSDIGMPNEDGYTLIGRVRRLSRERGGATPALALTAYARLEDRDRALQQGFQRHLVKPVEPVELVTAVAELAGRANPSSMPHPILDSSL